jgi:uncharacterized membrane protein
MQNDIEKGKTAAIISYFSIIGSIVAIFMNQDDSKSEFASFHIRQTLGIFLTWALFGYFVGNFDSWVISTSLYVIIFLLWIFGFLGAIQGEKRLVPLVGEFYQKIFKSL